MRGRKTMLLLSAAHCQVGTWQLGKFSVVEYFADNAEGHKAFNARMKICRDPVYLLTDLVEEDFRHETEPHLHGKDRTAVIQRKLEQYYRNTPFRQALTLQRRKDGRHDDEMLFSALTHPELITPWLNIMAENCLPLAGIYSLPNISVPLVKNISSDYLLLLSWNKFAGLRQTYFDRKMLRFSRLTPIDDNSSFSTTVGTEAVRSQQYLKNLSMLSPEHALNVVIICHANDRIELSKNLHDDSEIHYTYLDIQELGGQLKSKTVYPDSDTTLLFLHLLASHPPHNNYATAEHTHFLRLLTIRHALLGLSATLAAASLLVTAAQISEGYSLDEESQLLTFKTLLLTKQTRELINTLPITSASATDMKTAVLLSRKLNHVFPSPQSLLEGLGQTLEDFPNIRINKISWQSGFVESVAGTTPPQKMSAGTLPAQIILLNGELEEFSGDFRSALDHLERFRQALIQRGYSVTALTLPLDISSQGNIAADTCDGNIKPATFSLKILWQAAT